MSLIADRKSGAENQLIPGWAGKYKGQLAHRDNSWKAMKVKLLSMMFVFIHFPGAVLNEKLPVK